MQFDFDFFFDVIAANAVGVGVGVAVVVFVVVVVSVLFVMLMHCKNESKMTNTIRDNVDLYKRRKLKQYDYYYSRQTIIQDFGYKMNVATEKPSFTVM